MGLQRSPFNPALDAMPGATMPGVGQQPPDAGAAYPTHAQEVLIAQMDRPGETPEETAARQQQSDSRLMKLLGPNPTPPAKPNVWETAGAAASDIGGALAQLAWGLHPTHGSGRRRTMMPQPQGSSNALGALQARRRAAQGEYENATARRGLIAAQMSPAMDRVSLEGRAKETDQKIEAAKGVLDAWSRHHDPKSAKVDAFVTRMYGTFIDPDNGRVITEKDPRYAARAASITNAAQLELGMDPETAKSIVWHALGKARESASGIASREAQAGYMSSKTSDLATGADVAGGAGLSTTQYTERQKFVAGHVHQYLENPLHKFSQDPKKQMLEAVAQANEAADLIFGKAPKAAAAPAAVAPGATAPAAAAPATPNPQHTIAIKLGTMIKQARQANDYTDLVQFLDEHGHPASEFDKYPNDEARNAAIRDVAKATLMAMRDYIKGGKQMPEDEGAAEPYDPTDDEPAQ